MNNVKLRNPERDMM